MYLLIILAIILVIILRSIRQIDEYERGVKFRLGRYCKIIKPGWRLVLPIFESMKKVDIRTKAVDVPEQDAITKDNVSIRINAVLYYSIFDASKVIISVENYKYAVSQLAQTTMRNAVGAVTLDELLAQGFIFFIAQRAICFYCFYFFVVKGIIFAQTSLAAAIAYNFFIKKYNLFCF